MIVCGTKVSNNLERNLPNLVDPIELGIVVPFDDYKFLRAYDVYITLEACIYPMYAISCTG